MSAPKAEAQMRVPTLADLLERPLAELKAQRDRIAALAGDLGRNTFIVATARGEVIDGWPMPATVSKQELVWSITSRMLLEGETGAAADVRGLQRYLDEVVRESKRWAAALQDIRSDYDRAIQYRSEQGRLADRPEEEDANTSAQDALAREAEEMTPEESRRLEKVFEPAEAGAGASPPVQFDPADPQDVRRWLAASWQLDVASPRARLSGDLRVEYVHCGWIDRATSCDFNGILYLPDGTSADVKQGRYDSGIFSMKLFLPDAMVTLQGTLSPTTGAVEDASVRHRSPAGLNEEGTWTFRRIG